MPDSPERSETRGHSSRGNWGNNAADAGYDHQQAAPAQNWLPPKPVSGRLAWWAPGEGPEDLGTEARASRQKAEAAPAGASPRGRQAAPPQISGDHVQSAFVIKMADVLLSAGGVAPWSRIDFGSGCLGLSPALPFPGDLGHLTQCLWVMVSWSVKGRHS